MSEAKIRGKVHLIEETKSYGQKGFRKRLVVLEQANARFPNYVPLEFTREACDAVDDLSVGEEIEVSYTLAGRKWQKDAHSEVKFFLSAEAVSFKKLGGSGSGGDSGSSESESLDDANNAFAESVDEGDIPF